MFAFNKDQAHKVKSTKTFRGRFKIFLENITVHTYRNLVEDDRSSWERFLWIVVQLIFACGSITIIVQSWIGFTETPLITKLHNTLYPSREVPFPGITICNNNRISRRAAWKLAEDMNRRDAKSNRGTDYYMRQILHVASLYTFEFEEENVLLNFQRLLDELYEGEAFTKIADVMLNLTPRCEELMLRCFWQSTEYPCTNGIIEMFVRRRSEYGHCCSFNYVIRPHNVVLSPRMSTYTGPDNGLVLLIHGQPNDYYFQKASTKGFTVLVHNPYEYPDVSSGGTTQVPVSLGRETFMRIDSKTITADPFIINYSPETRKCLFSTEKPNKYGGIYTKAQCTVYCRMKSVLALCECVPFNMPVDIFYQNNGTDFQICSLNHIACLNKYKIKWMTVTTEIIDIPGLEREREESLFCPDCLPSCDDTKYTVASNTLPLRQTKRKGSNIMEGVKNVSQFALLRIYTGQPDTMQFLQTVQQQWFEIISNFGGIFGILCGFSLLSATEIAYFIIREIYFLIMNKWNEYKLEDIEEGVEIVP